MDIDGLFKVPKFKRNRPDSGPDDADGELPERKIRNSSGGVPNVADRVAGSSSTSRTVQEIVEGASDTAVDSFDLPSLKKNYKQLVTCLAKNLEMRTKYADDPSLFMKSEEDLEAAIRSVNPLGASPELYEQAMSLGLVPTLVSILSHENADIFLAVASVIKDLTDDDLDDDLAGDEQRVVMADLVESFVAEGTLELLVENLARLDETTEDERDGLFTTLAVIENILEFDPVYGEKVDPRWFLDRIYEKSESDSIMQYASEILAILLQASPLPSKARTLFRQTSAMDMLLKIISRFKRTDPKDGDMVETVQNLFDCLCSLISSGDEAILRVFDELEGVQLMLILLKNKMASRISGIRVLNFAVNASTRLSVSLIRAGGLKQVFPVFIGKHAAHLKSTYKSLYNADDDQEHSLCVLSGLLRNLKAHENKEESLAFRKRIYFKFLENDFEKLEHLLQLRVDGDKTPGKRWRYMVVMADLVLLDILELEMLDEQDLVKSHAELVLDHEDLISIRDNLREYARSLPEAERDMLLLTFKSCFPNLTDE